MIEADWIFYFHRHPINFNPHSESVDNVKKLLEELGDGDGTERDSADLSDAGARDDLMRNEIELDIQQDTVRYRHRGSP